MLRFITGLYIVFLIVCGAASGAERRVALVIGNSSYKYANKLPNPGNDAGDVARVLQRLGFSVTLDTDLDWERLAREVDAFLTFARGADVAIFFYAGHGLQHDGGAFILPTDARLENEFSLKRETFSVQEIVTQLGNTTRASIVLLDACRNNPLAERLRNAAYTANRALNIGRGLGRIDVGGNSLVVYAAAPGQEARDGLGRNSPFTESLLKHIETPGLEVEQMLKRVSAEVVMATGGRQQPERLSQLKIEVTLRPLQTEVRTEPSQTPRLAPETRIDDERRNDALQQDAALRKAREEADREEQRRRDDEERARREAKLKEKEELLRQQRETLERARREEAEVRRQEELRREEKDRARREARLKEKEELLRKRRDEIERLQKEEEAARRQEDSKREKERAKREARLKEQEELLRRRQEEIDRAQEEVSKAKQDIEKKESEKGKSEEGQEKTASYKPDNQDQNTAVYPSRQQAEPEQEQEEPRKRRKRSRTSERRERAYTAPRRRYYGGGGGGGGGGGMAPPAP